MIIPYQELSKEALTNLIEQFILREGTDYGETEVDKATKIEQVLGLIKSGEALIVYSELHEEVNIMSAQQFKQMQTEEGDYHIDRDEF
ncbi:MULTISPECIES: YheU family protein [unclassified Pseudoalteromonas]|uniref:YheU family protein n=1 Tax=unclassified Pseudoalteromonas TaxID=194690 RepID=UPI000CF602FE|nr:MULTISPECIES: YheU family protein [unclassified Pseudoalteromonas]MBS3799292.1 YheU family protein [Pseudoalteromonas sp. BDTF-M6]